MTRATNTDPFAGTKSAALGPLPELGAASVLLLVFDRLYDVLGLTVGGWADQDILAGEALTEFFCRRS